MLNKRHQKPGFTSLMLKLVLCFLSMGFISANSLANEAALYDLAPKGSAFLRLIDLRKDYSSPNQRDYQSNDKLTVKIKGKRLSTEAYCSASEFVYLPPGDYRKQINGMDWKGRLQPEQAYSLVVDHQSVRLIEDYLVADPHRALLAVHNYSNLPLLSLQTAKSAQAVFTNIPQSKTIARVINPVKSAFVVIDNGKSRAVRIATTNATIFQPGVLSSLFICADQAGIFTRWADGMGVQ